MISPPENFPLRFYTKKHAADCHCGLFFLFIQLFSAVNFFDESGMKDLFLKTDERETLFSHFFCLFFLL